MWNKNLEAHPDGYRYTQFVHHFNQWKGKTKASGILRHQAGRKLIYTTNAVEGYHRQLRKVTKTKGAFTSDIALLKLIYLATKNIEKKWTSPLQKWVLTVQQLAIRYGDRLPLEVTRNPDK